ncbi:MAG: hypothetical protein E7560_06585 [Ruminococcaceae bacterium]|nr:hypothetical protein [Oscillospiraceae bacterium]
MVKLCVSSISSGTERANLTGSTSVSIAAKEQKVAQFPRRGGYSSAGIIEKTGKNVTTVKVGDRVAVANSSHSQYIVMAEKNVYPIGDISFSDAALYFISTFSLAAIRKCRLEIGESAIVMGLDVLGLAALQLLRAAGATPIIAVDPDPEKREKALKSGADYALNPYDENFAATVKKLTDGGAKVGIEVTGVGAGLNGILDCMARFGRVTLLGCTRVSDFTIDYYRKVHGPGITLIGAHMPENCSMVEAAAIPETFATAYLNLFIEGNIKSGDTLLMNAGASGLASVIIPMAKAFGIRVITTVLTDEIANNIKHLNADRVFVTTKEDIAEVLKEELENGHPVDVAIDCLGGEIMGKCIHYLKHGVRWIMIAALAGQKTEIDLKNIYVRNVRIIGSTLRSRTPEVKAQILSELVEKVWPKVESGKVKPIIYKVLPITEAETAHDILYKGQNVGKVVLTVE